MTITKVINEILLFDKELLERIEFKCSLHYIELKNRGLLETFALNILNAKNKGCSFSIELIPDDSYIPLIEEIKQYTFSHFGALPHLSIPRDDKKGHKLLSKLNFSNFKKTWYSFDSNFFDFKLLVYKKKIRDYCFAGRASLYVDLATGYSQQCYIYNGFSFNIFENLDKPIPFCSIGKCNDCYCYNGHALLTIGCVKKYNQYKYGNIRNRIKDDGTNWIEPAMLNFMNEKAHFDDSKITIRKDKKKMMKIRLNELKRKVLKKIANNEKSK